MLHVTLVSHSFYSELCDLTYLTQILRVLRGYPSVGQYEPFSQALTSADKYKVPPNLNLSRREWTKTVVFSFNTPTQEQHWDCTYGHTAALLLSFCSKLHSVQE